MKAKKKIGRISGRVTKRKRCQTVAPSIVAASSSSGLIVVRPARKTTNQKPRLRQISKSTTTQRERDALSSQGSVVWKNWLITPYWVAKRFWKTRLTATMAKTLGKKMIGLKNFAPRMSFQRTRHASKKEITMRGKVCAAQ